MAASLGLIALLSIMGCACGAMTGEAHIPRGAMKPAAGSVKHQAERCVTVPQLRGGGATLLEPEEIVRCDNLLGEAPMWHEEEKALYWLDINGKKMCRYDSKSKEYKSWDLPEVAGSFAFAKSGGFLMGFASGLSWYNLNTGEQKLICAYEDGLPTRPNDGKCDRQVPQDYLPGFSTLMSRVTGKLCLWRLNAKTLELEEILDYRFRCSNTIAFNAHGDGTILIAFMTLFVSGDKMYFCDTPTQEIFRFDYSPEEKLKNKVSFWKMSEGDIGGPDGATVDSQGGLWEAQAGNWKVVRHRPEDGAVDYEIVLPFNNPTSCAIGDGVLYITTARHRLSEQERKEQPGAGQLWAVKLPQGEAYSDSASAVPALQHCGIITCTVTCGIPIHPCLAGIEGVPEPVFDCTCPI
eukprot:753399-Hanusia_phi.AAC.1